MKDNDWRLQGQEKYLLRRALKWSVWTPYREGWDHDHCSFCWAKISDRPFDEHDEHVQLSAAWVTTDDNYSWICPTCFDDFRQRFEWSVDDARPTQ